MSTVRFLVTFFVSILAVGFMACTNDRPVVPTENTPVVTIDASNTADTSTLDDIIQVGEDATADTTSDTSVFEEVDVSDSEPDSLIDTREEDTVSNEDVTSPDTRPHDAEDDTVIEDTDAVPVSDVAEGVIIIRTNAEWYIEGCAGYSFGGIPACTWHNFRDGLLNEISYNTAPPFEGGVGEILLFTFRNERSVYPLSVDCASGTWEITGTGNSDATIFANPELVRTRCIGVCKNEGRQLLCE